MNTLQKTLAYNFKNKDLLNEALTHSSCQQTYSYERLEFLGDRVLGLCMARLLFEAFPDETEGDLAKRHAALVQRKALYKVADKIKLGEYVSLSPNEAETGGRKKEAILADVIESLLGAIYLDGGYGEADKIVRLWFSDLIHQFDAPPQDAKTKLQEYVQSLGLPLPEYKLESQKGPSHAPEFTISVSIKGQKKVSAAASSKRKAEKKAAEKLIEILEL